MKLYIYVIAFLLANNFLFVEAIGESNSNRKPTFSHYESPYKGFATKHVTWARPWCKGKTRMLVLLPAIGKKIDFIRPGTIQRDVVELIQRFDLECDSMMMVGSKTGLPAPGKQAEKDLKYLLTNRKYDVIALANVSFLSLSKEMQYYILKQVTDGTGLVCIGIKPTRLFSDKWQIDVPEGLVQGAGIEQTMSSFGQLPRTLPTKTGDLIQTFRLGKARGVFVKYPVKVSALLPKQSYSIENRAAYEYWSAWIGKTILWAAGKLGNTEILPDEALNCRIHAKSRAGKKLSLGVTVKNIRGETVGHYIQQVHIGKNGETVVKLKHSHLPNGTYFAELLLNSERTIEAFACQKFKVSQEIKLNSVKLDREYAELGEIITVKVAPPQNRADSLRFELITADSRIISCCEEKLPAENLEIPFKITADMIPTTAMYIRVSLLKDSEVQDTKDLPFYVTLRNRQGFKFVIWDCPWDVLGYDWLKRLRDEAGVTSILSKGTTEVHAANSISLLIYLTTSLNRTSLDKKGYNQPFCWNDTQSITKFFNKLLNSKNCQLARQRGILGWSFGDEPHISMSCKSPTCVKAYHQYLESRYNGNINKLNEVWGEKYKKFSDVKLSKNNDLVEVAAYRTKNFSRWLDRQMFLQKTFLNVFKTVKPLIKKYDPKAEIGFEGAGRLGAGQDIEGIVETCDFWVTYDNPVFSIMDHLAPQNFMSCKWTGYNRPMDNLIQYTNESIMRGGDSICWWRMDVRGEYEGFMRSDMEFSPRIQGFLSEMKCYMEGLGDLLVKSKQADDGVRMFYSPQSILAAGCGKYAKFGSASGEYREIFRILEKLGVGWRTITPKLISKGHLTSDQVKVLILPSVALLDDQTAEKIQKFVQAGGTVIANVIPGVFDKYCRPRSESILVNLFGVKQVGPLKIRKFKPDFKVMGYRIELPGSRYDANLRPAGAKVLSRKGNVVYVNKFGRGKAILLNSTLGYYSRVRGTPMVKGIHGMFDHFLRRAGVCPAITARPVNPNVVGMIGISIWGNGDGYILGVQNRNNSSEEIQFRIPTNHKIIALRTNTNFDIVARQKIIIPAHRVRYFAIVPQLPEKIKVALSTSCKPGQKVTATITKLPENYSDALLVELIDPQGRKQLWSRKVIVTSGQQTQYTWVPAFNDLAGRWNLKITSVIGGDIILSGINLIK